MRFALIVDHPYRDLPSLALLAARLCQQGAICYLVPFNMREREIWPLAPDLVLLNYLRKKNERFARQLMEAGIQVGVLDTEGASILEMQSMMLAPDPSVRQRISFYCSWGKNFAEHAKREGWFKQEQLIVTGSPRFDFYVPPWREAALRASNYTERYPRPLVMIMGNFPQGNPRFTPPEQEAKALIEVLGLDQDFVLSWLRNQRQTMLGMVDLAKSLARRFPQITFVYRPHPFENPETYQGLLGKINNLHLSKEGAVYGWIMRATAVIQRGCFTAIEAGMAGVPALLPAWIPNSANLVIAEEVSTPCKSEGELAQAIESILGGNFQRPAYVEQQLHKVIQEWFYQLDGNAHKRVADCIVQNLPVNGSRSRLRRCRDLAYARGENSLKGKARAALVKGLGLSVHWSFRRFANLVPDLVSWDNSEKYFDALQVKTLVDAIQACAQDGSKQPLRRVGIQSAQARGDYHFGYMNGRSVTVFPL